MKYNVEITNTHSDIPIIENTWFKNEKDGNRFMFVKDIHGDKLVLFVAEKMEYRIHGYWNVDDARKFMVNHMTNADILKIRSTPPQIATDDIEEFSIFLNANNNPFVVTESQSDCFIWLYDINAGNYLASFKHVVDICDYLNNNKFRKAKSVDMKIRV